MDTEHCEQARGRLTVREVLLRTRREGKDSRNRAARDATPESIRLRRRLPKEEVKGSTESTYIHYIL